MARARRPALLASSTVQAFGGAPPPTMPSADFCAAIRSPCDDLSPESGTTAQTSRGKTDRLRRTPAGFTTPVLDDHGLRDHLLARPTGQASLSGSCPSGRGFAPRFLQTPSRDDALA